MSASALSLSSSLLLNTGARIPNLGLGVYRLSQEQAYQSVLAALKVGYRHIDTAKVYGNEGAVGRAIRDSGIPREQLFITTKLWNSDQGYESAKASCAESLKQLALSYVDLFLLHWPVPGARLESWRALEELYRDGKARSIGVSNFTQKHLTELLSRCTIVPAVNQFEVSVFYNRAELINFCQSKGICVECYSPLTQGKKLNDPRLLRVAAHYHRTPSQIMLRYLLQRNLVVLARSRSAEHIAENAQLFDFSLSEEHMKEMSEWNEDFVVCWDSRSVP